MSLSAFKNADEKIKKIIFGYIRKNQSEFVLNIPIMIQYVCMAYYLIKEQFAAHGTNIALNKTNINAHATNQLLKTSLQQTVYGNHVINAKDTSIIKYEWLFHYINANSRAIYIGIDSSNNKFLEDDFSDPLCNSNRFYAIGSNGGLFAYNEEKQCNCYGGVQFVKYQTGDIIVMTLETKGNYGKLMMKTDRSKNGTIIGDHIDLENDKYDIAIAMVPRGKVEIELIEFNFYHK